MQLDGCLSVWLGHVQAGQQSVICQNDQWLVIDHTFHNLRDASCRAIITNTYTDEPLVLDLTMSTVSSIARYTRFSFDQFSRPSSCQSYVKRPLVYSFQQINRCRVSFSTHYTTASGLSLAQRKRVFSLDCLSRYQRSSGRSFTNVGSDSGPFQTAVYAAHTDRRHRRLPNSLS